MENVLLVRSNPTADATKLTDVCRSLLPHDPFQTSDWLDPAVESYWLKDATSGEMVGVIAVERNAEVGESFCAPSPPAPGTIYLILVGIVESYRGKRYAAQALQKLLRQMRESPGVKRVVSNSRVSNMASARLHLATGFKNVRIIRNYYPNQEDTLVWERPV
jgi:RimJ/RimL family protein N-acetyltransferase